MKEMGEVNKMWGYPLELGSGQFPFDTLSSRWHRSASVLGPFFPMEAGPLRLINEANF